MDFTQNHVKTLQLEAAYDSDSFEPVDCKVQLTLTCKPAGQNCLDIVWKVDKSFDSRCWIDHPFLLLEKEHEDGDIVDNTAGVRALIEELFNADTLELTLTTRTTHVARLLAAISMFWT